MMQNRFTESKDFLAAILDGLPVGVIAFNMQGAITMCNDRLIQSLGIDKTSSQLLEGNILPYLRELPELHQTVVQCLTEHRNPFLFDALPFLDRYLSIAGRRIPNGMVLTVEDVTSKKQQESDNLNAILQAQENERQRMAREIHDGIGPILSTIKLHLGSLYKEVGEVSAKTKARMVTMSELIQEVATDIRDISHTLMPSVLTDLGLVAALENMCRKADNAGVIDVKFFHSGFHERMESSLALGVFRIAQELLNNALKHAKAEQINVQLVKHPHSIMLTVEDDGDGFDDDPDGSPAEAGIGLRNVETRTAALGGQFHLEAQLGHGVLATIEIPILS